MKKVKLNKSINKTLLLLVSVLIFSLYIPFVHAQETKVLRVGYSPESGFMEKENDMYSGYVYDYLREIAIYTGWRYEFIEMPFEEAMDALQKGEIDLLPGVEKNEDSIKLYDFTENYMGYTYTTLSVSKHNDYFDKSGYIQLDGLRVGYYEDEEHMLEQLERMNHENEAEEIDLIPYKKSNTRLIDKLQAKEIDIMVGKDQPIGTHIKVITNFNPKPYYLATTKGNREVVESIDYALFKIDQKNANFAKEIYRKYFQDSDYDTLILSKKQVEIVKHIAPLKVVYINDYIPIQYYDEEKQQHKGIFIDSIRLLSQKTGIPVQFVPVNTYSEAYEMLKNQKADLIAGVIDNYQIADAYDFELTKHYLKFNLSKVVNKNQAEQNGKEIIALPIGHGYIELSGDYEIHNYDTLIECLEAVNSGEATATYGNSYSVSNYIASEFYKNLYVITDHNEVRVAIGISKKLHPQVIRIINQAVYSLSDEEMSDIINENNYKIEKKISLRDFFIHNMEVCIWIIVGFLSIVGTLIYIIVKMRFNQIRETQKILFEKTQIDALTGVYNREACERLVTEYLQEKDTTTLDAFIIMDIDYFKQINDRFGHKMGDQLLIEFSTLLRQHFAQQDIVSRLGGDEFIVFMKDIDVDLVSQKLQILCEQMHRAIEYNGESQEISLSVGVIIIQEARAFGALYMMADEVLYEVKHEGKNGFKMKQI